MRQEAVHGPRTRVLIAGGSGQVGSALRASAPPGVEIQAPSSKEMDICRQSSVDAVIETVLPDLVINAAAYTQVERAEDESERARAINAAGAGNLAAACAVRGCPLIHLSTDYVFDGSLGRPYRENDTTSPLNVYGASKLEGERAVRAALDRHLILRVSWVFSATGSNFVKTMLGLSHRDEVRVVADQRGTPCGASAIAAAVWRIADRLATAPAYGTYHFATSPPTSWHGFAEAVYAACREANPAGSIPTVVAIPTSAWPTRAERPLNSVLSGSRLAADYGISPPDWREEVRSVVIELMRKPGNAPGEHGNRGGVQT